MWWQDKDLMGLEKPVRRLLLITLNDSPLDKGQSPRAIHALLIPLQSYHNKPHNDFPHFFFIPTLSPHQKLGHCAATIWGWGKGARIPQHKRKQSPGLLDHHVPEAFALGIGEETGHDKRCCFNFMRLSSVLSDEKLLSTY